ncbi:hypothetical protein DPEC_G00162720 [Dallia pectoralis]|uniref:Uncharacterized protein n=1 Tax=Dallia pectoralis TaxID=75939 RepID=A0ACC2GGL2_DALPE|nr:hypothetical protein DPEC_G00162720 [Dallia pectoralis]
MHAPVLQDASHTVTPGEFTEVDSYHSPALRVLTPPSDQNILMDLSANSGKSPTETGGHDVDTTHETDSGILSLQVLEFKSSLLEAVEELHIHREAETRYEQQISKLVLKKQELEWQKESLQQQIDSMANQHKESLANVKHEFQSKIRGFKGEKGKHQLTAELKDREINSLKEELKLLQLFKYSLEKKLSELEQKQQLQSQTKDSYLNQLGEVEKRFGTLSRQCVMVKLAQEKLEQNVEEAMRINKKLTSVNRTQESTIISLKQEVQEVNNKLIKAKVSSLGRSEENDNLTVKEQEIQQLQHRLNVETEMNTKLREEHGTERAEKREVMNSLQHAQQLLLTQTRAVSRLELELEALREEHQALKREQEVTRESTLGNKERFIHLIEEYRNSRITWENEKLALLEKIQCERQDLRPVNRADEKHTEFSCTTLSEETMHGPKGVLEHGKVCQRGDKSHDDQCVSPDTPAEDTVEKDGEAKTVESDYKRGEMSVTDVSDHIGYVGLVGCLKTAIDKSPQTSHCKAISGQQITGDSTLDSECHDSGGGGDSSWGEDKPSTVLQPPAGDFEVMAPPWSGSADGPTTLTDVVHVLGICVAGEAQPADSNRKPASSDPLVRLIHNVCSSSGDYLSNNGDVQTGLSDSENRSVYGTLDTDPVTGGTRDAEQEPSVYTREMVACQTTDKHGRSQKTNSYQDVDPGPADVPLTVSQASGPCSWFPVNVVRGDEIRCHTAEGREVVIPADESLSSSLSATVTQVTNSHIRIMTGEELSGSSYHLEPLNLSQLNRSQSMVAPDLAQSDCVTKKPPDKHELPALHTVPVTVDVLDSLHTVPVTVDVLDSLHSVPVTVDVLDSLHTVPVTEDVLDSLHSVPVTVDVLDSLHTVPVTVDVLDSLHSVPVTVDVLDSLHTVPVTVDVLDSLHSVPVTVDVLDSDCQGTLSESEHANCENEICGDVPSSCVTVTVNSPQSIVAHEGHDSNTTGNKLRPKYDNENNAEVTQTQTIPLTSKCQSDGTDFSTKINLSTQSDTINSEEETSEIIDYVLLSSKKRYRSSFELTTKKRYFFPRNMPGIAASPSPVGSLPTPPTGPPTTPVSDLKTRLSSGSQGSPSLPFTLPIFLKGRKNTSDSSVMTRSLAWQDTRRVVTSHQIQNREGWNSIRENFNEVSAEKGNRVHVPVSSVLPNISSMGSSRSGQNLHAFSSPGQPSFSRNVSADAFPPGLQDNGASQTPDIRTRIGKFEELGSERLRLFKRRKMDGCENVPLL